MGWFDTDKKIVVGTTAQRMVEDENLPETAISSVIRSIFSADPQTSIADNLIDDFSQSLALKVRRLYRWAEENYTYGLPTAEIGSARQGESRVQAIIDGIAGQPTTFDYFHYAPLNRLHVGWIKLVDLYGYNTVTNELAVLSATHGTPAYLKDLRVILTQDSWDTTPYASFDQWGVPQQHGYTPERPSHADPAIGALAAMSPLVVDELATTDHLEMTYVYESTPSVYTTVTVDIPLTGYVLGKLYFHVKYRYTVGATEHIKYWIYQDGAGTYPTLDAIHMDVEYTRIGSFYPWIHFRHNKVNLATDVTETTPDYESSVKACDYLGLDYQDLADSIDENPDIGDVEQAMLMMGVLAETKHEIGLKYLFHFFKNLAAAAVDTEGADYSGLDDQVEGRVDNDATAFILKDRDFAMTLSYGRIVHRYKAGKIGKVGVYKGAKGNYKKSITETYRPNPIYGEEQILEKSLETEEYTYQYQVAGNAYEEVKVWGLQLAYHIYKDKSFTAGFGGDVLLIPIDHNLAKNFSLPEREKLYALSMHLVFNSRDTIKTKWYQQEGFLRIIKIAANVWTAYSLGTSGFLTSLVGQSFKAAAWAVIKTITLAYGVQVGLEYLARLTGAEFLLLVAVVAVTFALGKAGMNGSLKGTPWAEDLLQLANGLAKASQTEITRQMEALTGEFKDLAQQQKEAEKELERGRALLGSQIDLLSPFEFLGQEPMVFSGETPEGFFARTIGSGNVGMQSIYAISSYVSNALTLPTLAQTEAEFYGTES